MDFTITAFERFYPRNCHAKFGGNWTTNKAETEEEGGGGGEAQCHNTNI